MRCSDSIGMAREVEPTQRATLLLFRDAGEHAPLVTVDEIINAIGFGRFHFVVRVFVC